MNANDDTKVQDELRNEEEEVISRTLSEHSSLCESVGEDKRMLLSVVSVYQNLPEYSGETISTSNSNPKIEKDTNEQHSESETPNLSSTNINATNSTETLSKQSSQPCVSGINEKEQHPTFLTPSQPLSREGSKSSRASNVSRLAEDELTVLSAEEIVEVDSAPMLRSSSSKLQLQELQMADVEVYGRPRAEYVPPRAFARRPNEVDDDEGINKGCYYFMSCLDAFWIL
jgi:hypothetical protein